MGCNDYNVGVKGGNYSGTRLSMIECSTSIRLINCHCYASVWTPQSQAYIRCYESWRRIKSPSGPLLHGQTWMCRGKSWKYCLLEHQSSESFGLSYYAHGSFSHQYSSFSCLTDPCLLSILGLASKYPLAWSEQSSWLFMLRRSYLKLCHYSIQSTKSASALFWELQEQTKWSCSRPVSVRKTFFPRESLIDVQKIV